MFGVGFWLFVLTSNGMCVSGDGNLVSPSVQAQYTGGYYQSPAKYHELTRSTTRQKVTDVLLRPFPTVEDALPWEGKFSARNFGTDQASEKDLNGIKDLLKASIINLPKEHTSHLTQLEVKNITHQSRGLANDEKIILHVASMDDDDETVSVFVHEMGHITDLSVLREGLNGRLTAFKDNNKYVRSDDPSYKFYRISWENNTRRKLGAVRRDFVSGYAMTDPFEDFAETYLIYRLHGDKFRSILPQSIQLQRKYDFMKTIVFEGEEFQTGNTFDTPFAYQSVWDATLLPLNEGESFLTAQSF